MAATLHQKEGKQLVCCPEAGDVVGLWSWSCSQCLPVASQFPTLHVSLCLSYTLPVLLTSSVSASDDLSSHRQPWAASHLLHSFSSSCSAIYRLSSHDGWPWPGNLAQLWDVNTQQSFILIASIKTDPGLITTWLWYWWSPDTNHCIHMTLKHPAYYVSVKQEVVQTVKDFIRILISATVVYKLGSV